MRGRPGTVRSPHASHKVPYGTFTSLLRPNGQKKINTGRIGSQLSTTTSIRLKKLSRRSKMSVVTPLQRTAPHDYICQFAMNNVTLSTGGANFRRHTLSQCTSRHPAPDLDDPHWSMEAMGCSCLTDLARKLIGRYPTGTLAGALHFHSTKFNRAPPGRRKYVTTHDVKMKI